MSAESEMPRYKSHKEVWALKIKVIKQAPAEQKAVHAGGDWYLVPEDARFAAILVGHDDYFLRHKPHPGGYYVVYEDGYKSFSPAEAFESGYTRLGRTGKNRTLEGHQVEPGKGGLRITVADEPGAGGAHHRYEIDGIDYTTNESAPDYTGCWQEIILFQNGPINEVGVNGVTHEVLLAILMDRLECFQAGPFACHENDRALRMLTSAQEYLHARTRNRMRRGVEGTHQV